MAAGPCLTLAMEKTEIVLLTRQRIGTVFQYLGVTFDATLMFWDQISGAATRLYRMDETNRVEYR
ncbi:hypothetical protein J6590_050737 [Homalodisca vitripennis]|nr:hypothetical protein J6590_050737 [Homalodisca vitripennis]